MLYTAEWELWILASKVVQKLKTTWTSHSYLMCSWLLKDHLERSALPLVVRSTMFVNPIPYDGHLTSSRCVNLSGTKPDSYRQRPVERRFAHVKFYKKLVQLVSIFATKNGVQALTAGPR